MNTEQHNGMAPINTTYQELYSGNLQMWNRSDNKYIFSGAVCLVFMSGTKPDKVNYTTKIATEYKPVFSLDLTEHVSTLRHVNLCVCTYAQNLTAVQICSNKTTHKHFLLQSELPS